MNGVALTHTTASSTTPNFAQLDDARRFAVTRSAWLRELWTGGLLAGHAQPTSGQRPAQRSPSSTLDSRDGREPSARPAGSRAKGRR